jgi:Calcineurin-like phosphoesterase
MATKSNPAPSRRTTSAGPPSANNSVSITTQGPQFGEPAPTPDPTEFTVKHGSDAQAYKILDSQKGKLQPRPFPPVKGIDEPVLPLAQALGNKGNQIVSEIQQAGQIVFHALGDTGNTKGPRDQGKVADKMVSDYNEGDSKAVPSFLYHLGDVVYSFGESQYYYDQFYDPFRDYPAPIFAVPGNHDGMVAPNSSTETLQAFLDNFCTAGKPAHRTPESGGLVRTAQIQPGVYFTLEAPFVRILGLYSNCLEDPGVISDQNGEYPYLSDVQLKFLGTALQRVQKDRFSGALLIAVHHPPYVSTAGARGISAGRHGGSKEMLQEIDAACSQVGVWPHAVLSGHAHNYQRFTRIKAGRETPFIVAGNGGHAVAPLTRKGNPALRAPALQAPLSDGDDKVVFENYDDQNFGYLRILVDTKQLRIEYQPASDGDAAKTPDDFVTVDLSSRRIIHYQIPTETGDVKPARPGSSRRRTRS